MSGTAQRRQFRVSYGRKGRRFTHPDYPGAVFVMVDRNVHFDGESRTAYVQGVRLGAPSGQWERFNEEAIQYV